MADVFDLEDKESILSFFSENGYVVVKDIISPLQCERTILEIGDHLSKRCETFDISDPSTYNDAPLSNNFGMYSRDPLFSQCLMENRTSDRMHHLFSLLYGRKDLLVNHDRTAFYRPTIDHVEWKTPYKYPGVHLDCNPHVYDTDIVKKSRDNLSYDNSHDLISENNMYCRDMDGEGSSLLIQGVLNLLDNREEDGGFHCVPGFHLRFDEWRKKLNKGSMSAADIYVFDSSNPNDMKYVSYVKRIACPAGAMIVWDQRLAHGTLPNDSNRPRLIQFVRMFPKTYLSSKVRAKRRKILRDCTRDIRLIDRNNVLDL